MLKLPVARHGGPGGGVALGVVVVLTAAVGIVAFLVGRGLSTPAQEAARSRAPRPSLLTAPVSLTHAHTTVVLRGTLTDGSSVSITPPEALGGDLPVVSAAGVVRGASVGNGDLVGAVAGRPVFVMAGRIPAFTALSFGMSNVNVSELQTGLAALGYSTSPDPSGTFLSGTARAVAALYTHAGYTPESSPGASSSAPGSAHHPRSYPEVALGEIQFVPTLPVEVVAVRQLGETVPTESWLARLGSGRLIFRVNTNANTASLLASGATGRAVSDLNGRSFAIRLVTKTGSGSQWTLSFAPVHQSAATAFVSQNMALKVTTGAAAGLQWVVPVAAVSTNADGQSSVTVVHGAKQTTVAVMPGLAYGGSEVVRPLHGGLGRGASVVVGVGG